MSRSNVIKISISKCHSFVPAGGFPSFMKKKENKKPAPVNKSISPMGFLSYKKESKNFYSLYLLVLESVSTILSFIL